MNRNKKKKPKIEFRYYQMPAGSPILALLGQKWIQEYGRDIDYLHFHNFLEIGYCYDGQGTLTLGEEDFRFAGGCFSVIPKNYPHTTNSAPDTYSRWEYLFIDVEKFLPEVNQRVRRERVERMMKQIDSQAVLYNAKDYPKIAGMIREILDIMRGTEEFYLEEAKGMLAALLVNIARENSGWKKGTAWIRAAEPEERPALPVYRALDYITLHYMEPIRVDELADWCHISEAHLRRLFSAYIKMSPVEYINLVRIRMACEYLKNTDDPVADIAHKCGFSVLSTFNRNFKEIMGVPPHVWRKRPENYEQQLLKFAVHLEEGW